jgi:hypothetical protein
MAEDKGEEKKDGVNRTGLDYRAGWCEALVAFGRRLQIEGARGKRGEVAGMEAASKIAAKMYQDMIAAMKATK